MPSANTCPITSGPLAGLACGIIAAFKAAGERG